MMNDDELATRAIARMRAPAQMHIICIDVTNKCDLKCSNCTRLLANQDRFWDMSLDNFRQAVRTLRDFPGTIAMLGGNPCMHRDFPGLCQVFAEEIPDKSRRGLWTNNVFKHAKLAEDTFGVFNLNPHDDERGVASLQTLKHLGWYYAGNSEHSSLLAAVKDFYEPPAMWEKIAECDINKFWSASIVENKGQLRAYFCEVAASFDLARGTDHGVEVEDGWWRRPLTDFASQIRQFCPGCGVPAKIKGHLDREETDTYSKTNADIALKAATRKSRKIVEVGPGSGAEQIDHPVTTYSTNLLTTKAADRPLRVGVVTPYYRESLDILRACHDSVRLQSHPCVHYLVADGHPIPEVLTWDVSHTTLPKAHGDNGNYARWMGAMAAIADGCDAIAFLDADNWFAADHIATMVEVHRQTRAAVCSAARNIHGLDGEFLSQCSENDGRNFVDTSCLFCTVDSFPILSVWGTMPRLFSPLADRVFWDAVLANGLSTAHSDKPTVAFRSKYPFHYAQVGRTAPAQCQVPADLSPALAAWQGLHPEARAMVLRGRSDSAGHLFPGSAGVDACIKRAAEFAAANRPDEAAAAYLTVLRAEPLHLGAMNNLAVMWYRLGKRAEAVRLLQMVVAADPTNEQFRRNLAEFSEPARNTVLGLPS